MTIEKKMDKNYTCNRSSAFATTVLLAGTHVKAYYGTGFKTHQLKQVMMCSRAGGTYHNSWFLITSAAIAVHSDPIYESVFRAIHINVD